MEGALLRPFRYSARPQVRKSAEKPESTRIRLAGTADAPAIAHLIGVLASDLGEPSSVTPDYVAEVLRMGRGRVLLAERGEDVLGMLSFYMHPSLYHAAGSCLIDELVIDPGARNQGLGATLLEEAIRRAQDEGWAEVSPCVMNTNTGALRFYQRFGFKSESVHLERPCRQD